MTACRTASGLLVLLLIGNTAQAHVGEQIYIIPELTDADLAWLDLEDGSVADWEGLFGDPVVFASMMYADPTAGDGAQYDPSDLDYRIWLAWHGSTNRIYLGMERVDDVHTVYLDNGIFSAWHSDCLEFMVDGDHSGGDYSPSADPDWTVDEAKLNHDRTAQYYVAIDEATDGQHVGYLGPGGAWVNRPPYCEGWGSSIGQNPVVTELEFYVTPFDDLIWTNPAESKVSILQAGRIIGFNLAVPDFDEVVPASGSSSAIQYHSYQSLSGETATWRYADRFVDGLLVGAKTSVVEASSWARIKAGIREDR